MNIKNRASFGFVLAVAPSLLADISQSTITPPGGFAQCGAYASTTRWMVPGSDLEAVFGLGRQFSEQAFSGDSTVRTSALDIDPPSTTNSASAVAALGYFLPHTYNKAIASNPYPAGVANGGWKDAFTISNAELAGRSGYLVYQVRARGTLFAADRGGLASLAVASYKDNTILPINPYFNRGNANEVVANEQHAVWRVWTVQGGSGVGVTINNSITFAAPFTFGQTFSLGVYATAIAGVRILGSENELNTGEVEFSRYGVNWNGIVSILDSNGQPVTGSTIVSGSGVDWRVSREPPPPCPADFNKDGFLDFFDNEAFVNCFDNSVCPFRVTADFNRDGFIDFFDYAAFVLSFETGC